MKIFYFLSLTLLSCVGANAQQNGLRGDYYEGTDFDRKVFSRIDPVINFNWRGTSPGRNIGTQYYSVRWTGQLQPPTSGRYQFTTEVDDGIRIWVGNRNVIDAWGLHNNDIFSGTATMIGGELYSLRIEYYNDIKEGEIKIYWQLVSPTPDRKPIGPKQLIATKFLTPSLSPKALAALKPPAPKPQLIPIKTTKPTPARVAAVVKPPKPKAVTVSRPVATTQVAEVTPAIVTKVEEPAPDKLESGKTIVLRNVLFQQSSYVLLPESYAELNRLVKSLREYPDVRIVISGHTDNVGDSRLNQSLSEFRAKVVMNYLVRHGVAEDRLSAKGYGCTKPVAGNDTEGDRAQNRRVEIEVN